MSESLEGLHHKIASATELGAVVRTMKALAASSITQYERAVRSLDDYYRTVELGLIACLRQTGTQLPRSAAGQQVTLCAVVFGSDQGLVGQFNEVLCEYALQQLQPLPGERRMLAVGERVQRHLAAQGQQVVGREAVPNAIAVITATVANILATLEAQREAGRELRVYLFHNRPRAASYVPTMQCLLPLDAAWQHGLYGMKWPTGNFPQVIGLVTQTLEDLLREYLFISLFRACTESLASENASRLAAMQRAEKNIDELLEGLQRDYHRHRQSNIDAELFDVLAGFEALNRVP